MNIESGSASHLDFVVWYMWVQEHAATRWPPHQGPGGRHHRREEAAASGTATPTSST